MKTKKSIDRLPDADIFAAAECLKLMAHPARLRIAELLTSADELPVHAIAEYCSLPPNQTCEHLRHMLRHGLLQSQRRGREVYYQATPMHLHNLIDCIRKSCINRTKHQEG